MKNGLPVLLFIGLVIMGCVKTNNDDQLTPSQLSAVQQMKSSYEKAKLYNDSLACNLTRNNGEWAAVDFYDHKFHFYESQFDSCHNLYEHNFASADHSHNRGGMVEMHSRNGMMNNGRCCSNGGHSSDIHQQMSALRELHYGIVRDRIQCPPNR